MTDNPTYPGFIDALYRSGARPVGVPPGDMGRLADAVTVHQPALAYLTPTHQNPTGLVLPAAERHEIVALARRHPGVTFIDDMTLAELPLDPGAFAEGVAAGEFNAGPQPPPLAALAPRLPNVVTDRLVLQDVLGRLRTGWVRAPEGIIARLAAAKAAADLGSPPFQQAILAALIRSSHEEIIAYRADWARQRYAAVAAALSALPARLGVDGAFRRTDPLGPAARRRRLRRVRAGGAAARRRGGARAAALRLRRALAVAPAGLHPLT